MRNDVDKTQSPMNQFFEVIYRLVIINLLWILGALMGGLVLGVFPALFSAFVIVKRLIVDKEEDFGYFKAFFEVYKKYFIRYNLIGYLIAVLISIVMINLMYVSQTYFQSDSLTAFGVFFTMMTLLFAYVVLALALYMPLTLAYFERYSVKDAFKFSLLSTLGTPWLTIQLIVIAVLSVLFFSVFISVTVFIGVSIPVMMMMHVASKRYRRFFLFFEEDGYAYMNYKFVTHKARYAMFLNRLVSDVHQEMISKERFESNILRNPKLDLGLSMVVLENKDQDIFAVMFVIKETDTRAKIELMMGPSHVNLLSVYEQMLSLFLKYSALEGLAEVVFDLNQTIYHKRFKHGDDVKALLKKYHFERENHIYVCRLFGGHDEV